MPNNINEIDWVFAMPVKKKVKKDLKQKAADAARDSLRKRVSNIMASGVKGDDFKNAIAVMGGRHIKEENVGNIVTELLKFLESVGYTVVKNQTTAMFSPETEYIIASERFADNRQFCALSFDEVGRSRVVIQEDSLGLLLKNLEIITINGEAGDRYSVRNGFSIQRRCSPNEGASPKKLYEWLNAKKFFGKRVFRRATADKTMIKVREARKILLGAL